MSFEPPPLPPEDRKAKDYPARMQELAMWLCEDEPRERYGGVAPATEWMWHDERDAILQGYWGRGKPDPWAAAAACLRQEDRSAVFVEIIADLMETGALNNRAPGEARTVRELRAERDLYKRMLVAAYELTAEETDRWANRVMAFVHRRETETLDNAFARVGKALGRGAPNVASALPDERTWSAIQRADNADVRKRK